jgi:hypothetical protein
MKKKRFFIVFIAFIGLSLIIPPQYALCKTGGLYVGVAKMDITPPVGIKMSGYAARERAHCIHDPLYAKVLVFEVEGQRIAIISCDLGGYYNKKILDTARKRFNIPHILISARTSSKSAPAKLL